MLFAKLHKVNLRYFFVHILLLPSDLAISYANGRARNANRQNAQDAQYIAKHLMPRFKR
jgi:hypothetical protein